VRALADEYWAAWLERNPEFGTFQGIPGTRHDRLQDNSLEALRSWHDREDAWWERVGDIDESRLVGRPEWTLLAYVRESLDASRQQRVCRGELWSLNPVVGWHLGLPLIARFQPVGTARDREAALQRWRSVPRFVDTEIANLREGLRLGYRAAVEPTRRVAEQVGALAAAPPRESPLFAPVLRDSTPEFEDRLEALIAEGVNPALRRYERFLRTEYLPAARTTPGVAANPDGAACYRARVRGFTTLDLDPEQLYRRGLQEVESIKAERTRLASRHGATDAVAWIEEAEARPENRFESREEILEYSRDILERVRPHLDDWFGILPESRLVVEPFPEFQERNAPGGQYFPGPPEEDRPGIYRINTYTPREKSRIGLETLAFHEAIPGHHLQLAIANERKDAHPVTRYLINSGFAEGWALYAERLADEMGLFSSDAQRVAMLNGQLGRAARMVVDPAIHVLGWSRQDAVDYFAELFGEQSPQIEFEIDRYIAWPGQATSYTTGSLEIRRLREEAERRLGDEFDIRTFHDRVLEDGAVPLPVLRSKIRAWIELEVGDG
jgi:uncharacterized protein (DUF885 family)